MRALLFPILCLSLAVCITADGDKDFVLGERRDGDRVITNRYIFKPPIPKIMRVTINVNTASQSEIVNHVKITNMQQQNNVNFILLRGNVNTTSLAVHAVGELSKGLYLKVEAYGLIPPTTTTTEATPPEETTVGPSTAQ